MNKVIMSLMNNHHIYVLLVIIVLIICSKLVISRTSNEKTIESMSLYNDRLLYIKKLIDISKNDTNILLALLHTNSALAKLKCIKRLYPQKISSDIDLLEHEIEQYYNQIIQDINRMVPNLSIPSSWSIGMNVAYIGPYALSYYQYNPYTLHDSEICNI